jgi:hypothetical protein
MARSAGKGLAPLLTAALLLLGAASAQATPVTIDQIIYEDKSAFGTTPDVLEMSGTLDVTASGNTLTILLTNTSSDAAFLGGGKPGTMLLTGFGIELGGLDILSGIVTVNALSTALNFGGGQSTPDISNQWLYANGPIDGYSNIPGALSVDTVTSSIENMSPGAMHFAGAINIDGPDYGALSAFETEFGAALAGVQDTIKFELLLSGAAPDAATIDAGNVVLAFGSPALIPEPGTGLLLGMGLLGLAWYRRGR